MGTKRTQSTRGPATTAATAVLPTRQADAVASPAEQRGLECRACGCRHFEVLYTRPRPGGIMRVRQCRHCGKRLMTRETAG
jgi:hypothetical protein